MVGAQTPHTKHVHDERAALASLMELLYSRVYQVCLSISTGRSVYLVLHLQECLLCCRHPSNGKLLKVYARFLEFVQNDPWGEQPHELSRGSTVDCSLGSQQSHC